MCGNSNELYGVVCGGPEGRSGTELLWSACCVCGILPLWFFRNLFSPPQEPPRMNGGGSLSFETPLEAPVPGRATTHRGGGDIYDPPRGVGR